MSNEAKQVTLAIERIVAERDQAARERDHWQAEAERNSKRVAELERSLREATDLGGTIIAVKDQRIEELEKAPRQDPLTPYAAQMTLSLARLRTELYEDISDEGRGVIDDALKEGGSEFISALSEMAFWLKKTFDGYTPAEVHDRTIRWVVGALEQMTSGDRFTWPEDPWSARHPDETGESYKTHADKRIAELERLAYMDWCPFGEYQKPHDQTCVCGGDVKRVTWEEWHTNQAEGHALTEKRLETLIKHSTELEQKLGEAQAKASKLDFFAELRGGKYTCWAADLPLDQIVGLLWLLGEWMVRGCMTEPPMTRVHVTPSERRALVAFAAIKGFCNKPFSVEEVRKLMRDAAEGRVQPSSSLALLPPTPPDVGIKTETPKGPACAICEQPFGKNYWAGVPTASGKKDLCEVCHTRWYSTKTAP